MQSIQSQARSKPANVIIKDFKLNKYKYLMILPVIIYVIIFAYKPMYGIIIAFKDYRPSLGIAGSRWVGLDQFAMFFKDVYFLRILRNTFSISFLSILFEFPAPILLALLLNELKNKAYKRTVQTITYMPYFISVVVICGLIKSFSQTDGAFNDLIVMLGGTRINMLANKELFYAIYIFSGIWQTIGWNSIIYLAALSGIDQSQYEAATIDGAGRLRQVLSVTLPGLMPIIAVLFILRMGNVLNVGFEKILLLYQPLTYEVADVISTYVFRKGILEANFSYSAAVGLFNSVVNVFFLLVTNKLSKKVNEYGVF